MLGRWGAVRLRASLPARPHAPCACAKLSTASAARAAGSSSSPAQDYKAGGWMDPFEDNPHFRSQDEASSGSDALNADLEEYVDPSSDRAARGWAPRGSDFMDARSTIPQRERAALSNLFSQFEQRVPNSLPVHSSLDFSRLGRTRTERRKASSEKPEGSRAAHLTSETQEALRAFARDTRLRPRILSPYREVLRESTTVSAQQMDAMMKQVAAELQDCTSEVAVWNWAEANVFPPAPAPASGGADALSSPQRRYGMNSPYYAPVLVELVVTLRDRFRSPHMAVALYERMKNVSLASYVQGCSGMLLKEMLLVYWVSLHDYDRVAQIVTEAQAAGVISFRNQRSKRASPDEEPLHQLIKQINDEASSEIQTLYTDLIKLPSQPDDALSPQPADLLSSHQEEASAPRQPSSADAAAASQDFWSAASHDKRPGSVGMYDPLGSDLLPEGDGGKALDIDLHDLAGSLQEGEDVFGQVFQEETDLQTVRTASPFPGAPAAESEALPGKALPASPQGRAAVADGPGAGSLQYRIKTHFTGELLAARVAMVNRQLGLHDPAPHAERGKGGRRRFNHPNFHRPPHSGHHPRHSPRAR